MDGLVIALLLLGLVLLLLWFGYQLGRETEQEELSDQRQVLDAEWTALEQTRRVNDVFFRARDAMRRAESDAKEQ
jgi:hypothetical protein